MISGYKQQAVFRIDILQSELQHPYTIRPRVESVARMPKFDAKYRHLMFLPTSHHHSHRRGYVMEMQLPMRQSAW